MDFDALNSSLMGICLALPRIVTAFAIVPIFGKHSMSQMIRSAVATAFAIPLIPLMLKQAIVAPNPAEWLLLLLLKEAALGFMIGFCIAVPFWAAEAIGFIIDNQRGAGSAQMQNTSTDNESSPLGVLTNQAYTVLFIILGGLPLFISTLYQSYLIWPVTGWLPEMSADMPILFLKTLDQLLKTAVLLAAPAMLVMLLTELSLALASLFAPQMQVFFLAMPIKSGAAIFVLSLYLTTLFDFLSPSITHLPQLILPPLKAVMP